MFKNLNNRNYNRTNRLKLKSYVDKEILCLKIVERYFRRKIPYDH